MNTPKRLFLCAAWVAGVCLLCACASMTTAERAYIGASVADVATTAVGLSRGLEEQNPILRGGSDGETLARAVVLNVPGSPGGAVECLEAVVDVVPHALRLLQGETGH